MSPIYFYSGGQSRKKKFPCLARFPALACLLCRLPPLMRVKIPGTFLRITALQQLIHYYYLLLCVDPSLGRCHLYCLSESLRIISNYIPDWADTWTTWSIGHATLALVLLTFGWATRSAPLVVRWDTEAFLSCLATLFHDMHPMYCFFIWVETFDKPPDHMNMCLLLIMTCIWAWRLTIPIICDIPGGRCVSFNYAQVRS